MGKICCTCLRRIEEDSAVLTMGAYGNPKLLCDDCASLIETITVGREYEAITEAMHTLTKTMSDANVDDRVTVATVTEILEQGAKRAQKIKEGTYDFALDNDATDGFDEIPDELLETEEDRLLDKKDEEANAKFDKIMNFVWVGVGVAAAALLIWKLIELFIIK